MHSVRDAFAHNLHSMRSIVNPTLSQLQRLLPHLSHEQIKQLPWPEADSVDVTIALPPLLVQDACQVALLRLGPDGSCSITVPGEALRPGCDGYDPLLFREEAQTYAHRCWQDSLRRGDWPEVVRLQIYEPSRRDVADIPQLAATLWCALGLSLEQLRRPQSGGIFALALNAAVDRCTYDPFEVAELMAGRPKAPTFGNCGGCGGGLNSHPAEGQDALVCVACDADFPAVVGLTPWTTPLPPKLVNSCITAGVRFEACDPARLYNMP